jgi:hypothetical protein
VYYEMINKKSRRARFIDGKGYFIWKCLHCEILQFAIHYTYRDISFLINNQAPSCRSEWSAFIMTDLKAREVAEARDFKKIWFHSIRGVALRRGHQQVWIILIVYCTVKNIIYLEYYWQLNYLHKSIRTYHYDPSLLRIIDNKNRII